MQRHLYQLQLLWLTGAQLYTLGGGENYPVPDPYSLFTPAKGSDQRTAQEIRRDMIAQFTLGKEAFHGYAL